jgi:hypothetical protein
MEMGKRFKDFFTKENIQMTYKPVKDVEFRWSSGHGN